MLRDIDYRNVMKKKKSIDGIKSTYLTIIFGLTVLAL